MSKHEKLDSIVEEITNAENFINKSCQAELSQHKHNQNKFKMLKMLIYNTHANVITIQETNSLLKQTHPVKVLK